MSKLIDLTGKKFGRLKVIERTSPKHVSKQAFWLCVCDCGKETIVAGHPLRIGHTQSCGCIHSEVSGDLLRIHGKNGTPAHISWRSMIQRCFDENSTSYPRYGGRGITVCERWLEFKNFHLDMGDRPKGCSLDRIDPNGHYEPGNARWATNDGQSNNKRNSRLISIDGETMTIAEASKKYGIAYHTLHSRLRMGWTPVEAVSISIERNNRYVHPKSKKKQ